MSCRFTRLFKPREMRTACVIPMSDRDRRELAELQRRRQSRRQAEEDSRRRQLETVS